MKSQARVVVIGGGVVGCSVLYHLTRFGWTDVMLLERSELTSGSTWHAAGGMHTINGDPNVAKLQKYTVELYKEIEEYSGQDIGLHMTGGIMLAATRERFDWLKSIAAKGRYLGLEAQILSPTEAHELMPLIDPDQFVGALYDKVEGHLDPYGTTHAYAKSAKKNGATIELHTMVEDLVQRADGTWDVITNKGNIHAEHVVNAAGLWAREVGRMTGLELPVLAMEHMYLITEQMPEVVEFNERTGREMLHAVDFDGELYLRQEGRGMLMGTYEKDCRPWSAHTTPWTFGHELLESDLDRITPELEVGFTHFPAFNNAGIKQVINGPFTFSPDGNPLVGPVPGKRNLWSACAVMAGFSQGGGVGLALANWMIDGDPGMDVFAMDIARFGNFASRSYTNKKVRENYSRRFSIRFPNEELPAGRPLKTSPLYEPMKAAGAQFTASHGLEVPLWFAPPGTEEQFSWRRSTDFAPVGDEVRAVRSAVGLIEISGFAKYSVTGADSAAYLDRVLACQLPAEGRMTLAPMLKHDGKLIGDFTVANLGDGEWFIAGSGIAEDYHMRWFRQQISDSERVDVRPYGMSLMGVSIVGPRAREVLAAVTDEDVSAESFRFMDIRHLSIGMAQALVGRVSFTGDLGYEIWTKPEDLRHVYDVLMAAGEQYGIRLFGLRALNSLRLEKNYGGWAREYRPIYTPFEAELGYFVALDKSADFIGKAAAVEAHDNKGGPMRLRGFVVDVHDADVIGDEPIYLEGKVCGWVTSGGYAHHSQLSMAMGYVPRDVADTQIGWEVEILGERLPARLQRAPVFDADGSRMRG
ncbi:GcvT family protein [Granulosicoccus antarcticus]|uniref:4-methylaminobutanoate oxidase (Formaldehyde-forming) n=1 Tax=Granulosicoccus antarcticus IMCC3135 TaxID=1192854 RepID=A0A2Z2NXZ3_9GAMM|nr:FAD-dependent oxidoreductase [Granulosicoccus antarcticus]ASJ73690.1 4-methylaminobutanoate oxidase (formaldehyde-forming) [Granulosicoccus antarcticus IMCC3135]